MPGTTQDQPIPYQEYPPPTAPTYDPAQFVTDTKSPLIAMICGIVSFAALGPVAAIPAIIFGLKGRREAGEGRTTNRGMATAGLWLGITNLALSAVLFAILLGVFVLGLASDPLTPLPTP